MSAAHTPGIDGLQWYVQHGYNNGRGRITGRSAKLLKAGYLRLEHTSANCWALSLSDKGRAAIAKALADYRAMQVQS